MDKNSESIYGCGASKMENQDWGRYTQKGNLLYAHCLNTYLGDINAKGLKKETVKNVFILAYGAELPSYQKWFGNQEEAISLLKWDIRPIAQATWIQ